MLDATRHVQRACSRFENRFGYVVLISAVHVFHMKIEPPLLRKRFQKFLDQFRLQVADARGLELDFVYQIRPPGKIDNNPCHARNGRCRGGRRRLR